MNKNQQQHIFTVTFSDREWYIMEKILQARGDEPEIYIYDAVVGLFHCDIDECFGVESKMRVELHICEKALKQS